MKTQHVYFIPGRGETVEEGLGQLLTGMGYTVYGREILSDFALLRFSEQCALVRSDVESFWHGEAVLIGRSYGGYLLLHTLADMEPFPGKILLCSPVLGAARARGGFFGSRPPRAERLLDLAQGMAFPTPRYMEIHTGAEDNGCNPELATRFASLVDNTTISIVSGAGHKLGETYLQVVLKRFLTEDPPARESLEFNL